jgi:serine/threonine-protein kinase RsbW
LRRPRRFVAGVLDGCPAAGDALVCVSELATNAVLHSRSGRPGGRFTVCATARPGSLRVAVADEGGPWGHERGGDGQNGRGLLIVGGLASRWGRDEGGAGRTVWFEIDW